MRNSHFKYLTLAMLIFAAACTRDTSQSEETADSTAMADRPLSGDSTASVPEDPGIQPLPYIVQYDQQTGKFNIDKNPAAETVAYTAEALANALNHKYAEIQLRVGDRRNDTLDLYIDSSFYLTQSIGSAGANNYLAEATFAFTELDSVEVVNFNFEPGDHAMPGPYTRRFFDGFH